MTLDNSKIETPSSRLARYAFWACFAAASFFAIVPLGGPAGPSSDKMMHILAFVTLTTFAVLAFRRTHPLVIAALLSIYGMTIEIVQMIPSLNRDAELLDAVADIAAIGFTLIILLFGRAVADRRKSAATE